ncbi:hypothetical protein TorRG33x02_187800 [Trema orientale]|uniref:Uncharacterized protein n=1 Tax=Trema orientale TaxID=63057 RepID=A0A2P5EIK2_TREOI|nr:hypothetical protein TorRG33x02_187800 [Trema orientale]
MANYVRNENKRKAKALVTERAMHMTRRRETKMTVVSMDFWEETDEKIKSILKERRVVVRLGGSSS